MSERLYATLEARVSELERFLDCTDTVPGERVPQDIFELMDKNTRLLVQHIDAAERRIAVLERRLKIRHPA